MRRFSPFLLISTLVFALAAGAGCSTNRKPLFDMSTGEPEQFRRYTGRPAADFIVRFDRRAFEKTDAMKDSMLTADKRDVLDRHGQPDYAREGVDAHRDEIFDEWAYWDRNTIVQFIEGKLVYEGPLLDSDRYLITYGYPSKAYFQQYETGPVRETWVYEGFWRVKNRSVSFSDGSLVYQSQF
ncbi:MAG: hypothetical protein RLY93_17890 [Sumerlaeia bacterium]